MKATERTRAPYPSPPSSPPDAFVESPIDDDGTTRRHSYGVDEQRPSSRQSTSGKRATASMAASAGPGPRRRKSTKVGLGDDGPFGVHDSTATGTSSRTTSSRRRDSRSASGSSSPPLMRRRPSARTQASYDDDLDEDDEQDEQDVPLGPPYDTSRFDTDEDWRNYHEAENRVSHFHHLPLVLVTLPPLGAVIHGRAENWTDAMILVLIVFYLHYIVKVPWEIYYASRTRRILQAAQEEEEQGLAAEPPRNAALIARQRHEAQHKLERTELWSLLLTLLAPALGSYFLYFARRILYDPDRFVNTFTITLFALATGVKPLLHFADLMKKRTLYYQETVHYPSTQVYFLKKKIERLESDIAQLSKVFASKSDVRVLRDGIDVPLTQLSKAVRRYERKEEYLRLTSEERFALLDSRLEEASRESAINAELIEQFRKEQEAASHPVAALIRLIKFALEPPGRYGNFGRVGAAGAGGGGQGHGQGKLDGEKQRKAIKWYEKGPLYYLFLPVNISSRAIEYASQPIYGPPALEGRVSDGP